MNKWSEKTVLVTGATGLIGSHIVDELMKMGNVKVIALSRSAEKLEKGFAEYIGNKNFSYIAQNVTEPLNLEEESVDYIFHAAGPMEGKIIANYPVDVIKPNILGTMNCLEFLHKQQETKGIKGRMVLFSSVTVYGNNTETDIRVKETDTQVTEVLESGSAPYSQSKRMSEVIALAYAKQFGVDVVIARFSTVYGNTRFIPDTAFYEFINKSVAGENIVLNGSGFARRDNIYVDDAVKGVLVLAISGLAGEAYNVSSGADMGNFLAVDEIAQVISQTANKKYGRLKENSVRVLCNNQSNNKRKAGVILDNTKLQVLGWQLEHSFADGISKTLANYNRGK